jgi:hypothetical protein
MKRNEIGCLLVLALTVVGCGSDSPSEQQQYKDAAVDSKDAPAAADTRDAAVPNTDVVVPDDTKDAPAIMSDATSPQADALDVAAKDLAPADALGFVDARLDTGAADLGPIFDAAAEQPAVDTKTADLAPDSPAVIGYPCRNDSDCCIEIDSCMNIAYLYSKAPGAAPPYAIQPRDGGACTACIPPTIQVRCVSSQCVGERIAGYPGALMSGHCGFVALDAGSGATPQLSIDAGSVSTQSVWTCSGGG